MKKKAMRWLKVTKNGLKITTSSNTETEPDLTLQQTDNALENDRVVEKDSRNIAVEVKASTSSNHESVDALVGGGIQQLKKRQDTNKFTHLDLRISVDNNNNTWPLTQHMYNTAVKNGTINKPETWDERLKARIQQIRDNIGITLPLQVAYTFQKITFTVTV
jgi:hypothetical protein